VAEVADPGEDHGEPQSVRRRRHGIKLRVKHLQKNPHGDIKSVYETLAIEDIRMAADALRPVYDDTKGADGYVSFEVSPKLAKDTAGTISEAEALNRLNRALAPAFKGAPARLPHPGLNSPCKEPVVL
jgi:hypothetical protein